jgi:hypothetical protein
MGYRLPAAAGLSFLALSAFAPPAYAYLDPGTASLLLQGIIGGVAATVAAAGVYIGRVKNFFSSKSDKEKKDDNKSPAE